MKNIMTTRRTLEILHMDLFGPNAYKSLGGDSFGLVIVDDFSRFTWVFFLDDKSKVQKIFENFAKHSEEDQSLMISSAVLDLPRSSRERPCMTVSWRLVSFDDLDC